MDPLSKLAEWLRRRPIADPEPGDRVKLLFYVTLAAATCSLFALILGREISRWNQLDPELRIAPTDWHVLYEAAPDASNTPPPEALWESAKRRDPSPGVAQQRAHLGLDFWIGVSLQAPPLAEAARVRANNLILGWIKGDYRIWLNGEPVTEGSRLDREPIVLTLPPSSFKPNAPLRIAVHIHPEPGAAVPDALAQPLHEGLATHARASAYKSLIGFWKKSRPFGLFLANLLISVFFFLFWNSDRRRREYFYIAAYGLVCACFQVRLMDLFLNSFSQNVTYSLDLVLRFNEAALAMFLGFAFARARREIFLWGLPLAFLLPLAVALALPDGPSRYYCNSIVDRWVASALYLTGVAACLLQRRLLMRRREGGGLSLPVRERQLLYFAAGLGVIAILSGMESFQLIPFVERAIFSRAAHLVVMVLLGAIALRDYREERRLIERMPVSRYHRKPQLPESVSGAVLIVDLKGSERLFRAGAESGEGGARVEACLSHLWSAAIACGGTVLQTEGDSLRVFFDEADCPSPALSALRATDEMTRRLWAIADQFGGGGPIHFRGGMAVGRIRPIWQEMEGTRMASWGEAGDSNVFVESTRMMELERQVKGERPETLLLVPASLVKELSVGNEADWCFTNRSFAGKHGRIYAAGAYAPARGMAPESAFGLTA